MSLINCPECGKERVSDSAASCPSCGFGIRGYYEAKKNNDPQRREAINKLTNTMKNISTKKQVKEEEEQQKLRDWEIREELLNELNRKRLYCPVCGSGNVSRISTTGRLISVLTVGFASSKIGKQYMCKICKHKW